MPDFSCLLHQFPNQQLCMNLTSNFVVKQYKFQECKFATVFHFVHWKCPPEIETLILLTAKPKTIYQARSSLGKMWNTTAVETSVAKINIGPWIWWWIQNREKKHTYCMDSSKKCILPYLQWNNCIYIKIYKIKYCYFISIC